MNALYLMTYAQLVCTIMLLGGAILAQTVVLVYGFFQFRYRRSNLPSTLLEGSVLGHLLVMLCITAGTALQAETGFLIHMPFLKSRLVLFGLMTLLSIAVSVQDRAILPLSIPFTALFTLPGSEIRMGSAFPTVFIAAGCFWLFRAANHLWNFRRQRREKLSAFSVKEAVDTMDFGLLFCRTEGLSDGQILLCNRKMQDLMFSMAGRLIHNGNDLAAMLVNGIGLDGCTRAGPDDQLIYTLPDGSVWQFDLQLIRMKRNNCALIVASDTTAQWKENQELSTRNRELEQRNGELQDMFRNLDEICRTEETLRMKSRVHDLLGQRISMLLRSVREHRELDETLLASFADGLPGELKNAPSLREYNLQNLAKDFHGLGVTVNVHGQMPCREPVQKLFYEISAEAMTNAVLHGYATQIDLFLTREDGAAKLRICDNGIPKAGPVTEGGGLRSMRRKTLELGGSFSYRSSPHFELFIRVPEGESL